MPTYNIFGWQRPCYLLQEGYAATFEDLMETTDWENYGTESGNEKCQDCMVHCGYEATAVDSTFASFKGLTAAAARHPDGQAMTTESDAKSGRAGARRSGDAATLAEVIERAFDYRGDVTIVRRDGTEIVGYLFNRDATAAQPFVQVFEQRGGQRADPALRRHPDRPLHRPRHGGRQLVRGLAAHREAAKAARSAPDV